jgi:hypothetical protein
MVLTPYEKMRRLLEHLNDGVQRDERWTLEGERSILARPGMPYAATRSWPWRG